MVLSHRIGPTLGKEELRQVYPALFDEEVEVASQHIWVSVEGFCIEADAGTACVSPYKKVASGWGHPV